MEGNQSLISVIVPVYKVEQYLDKCVESIVNQTYRNLEIILVDDGSPDNCPAMCDGWAKKDDRIKVIHKANGGLSDARNAGIAVASGEFIGFVDSDDWVAPFFYERLISMLIDNDCDISACGIEKVNEGQQPKLRDAPYSVNCIGGEEALHDLICGSITQVVWNKLYRRETIDGIPFAKGKFHEDEFWSYQVFGKADRIAIADFNGYYYLQRTGSIMGEGYSLKRLDAVEAKCERQRYLEANFPELVACGKINLLFYCLYQGQMALRYTKGKERKKAMERLIPIAKEQHFSRQETKTLSFTHRVWLKLGRSCFIMTCRIRNLCKIGL